MEFFALSDKQLYPVTGDCGRKDKLVPAITLSLKKKLKKKKKENYAMTV